MNLIKVTICECSLCDTDTLCDRHCPMMSTWIISFNSQDNFSFINKKQWP